MFCWFWEYYYNSNKTNYNKLINSLIKYFIYIITSTIYVIYLGLQK